MRSIAVVFGTRPEAIKMCPVVLALRNRGLPLFVCTTGQHRELLDQVLSIFDVEPDLDLFAMRDAQSISEVSSRILSGLDRVFGLEKPRLVLVQGDTTTTFCGALTAFNRGIPVGHVEAGLRSGSMRQPFPEEMNRCLTTKLSSLHFAPTRRAAQNLIDEGIDFRNIMTTGNTGIDALLMVAGRLATGELRPEYRCPSEKRLIVVSAHRRESLGAGVERICSALGEIARRDDVHIVFPVHPNPEVSSPVHAKLGGIENISLITPLDYASFVNLLNQTYLILTDSGGLQEEGPSLGKPVLVMRDKTERLEGIKRGAAKLVGTSAQRIVDSVAWLLDDQDAYEKMANCRASYGDGTASEQIAESVEEYLRGRVAA